MLERNRYGVLIGFVMVIAIAVVACVPVIAQCPLCKLAVENSAQGKAMGRGLNLGILVLLVPPVTIFCSLFIVAIKHRKGPERDDQMHTSV